MYQQPHCPVINRKYYFEKQVLAIDTLASEYRLRVAIGEVIVL